MIALMEQGLCAAGVSVTTATTDDDGPGGRLSIRPAMSHGARRVYFRKWLDFYKFAPGMLFWLWRHVRAFDVVHIHAMFSFTSVVAGLVARSRGVPYIVRPLGTLRQYGLARRRPWFKRLSLLLLEARILRKAAAVHFTSVTEWEEAETLNLKLRGVLVPLAVGTQATGDRESLLQDYPIVRGHNVILFLSRLDPVKNVESLLTGFAAVRARHRDVMLLVAGDGHPSYVASLKSLTGTLKLESSVIWLGGVKGAQKAAVLAVAEIFVLPSLSESFGIAAAEAMLAGLPCVLGEGVAIAQQAGRAGASIVVSSEPEAIAQALLDLLADKARRLVMAQQASQFAKQEFSIEAMVGRLVALYRRVGQAGTEGV